MVTVASVHAGSAVSFEDLPGEIRNKVYASAYVREEPYKVEVLSNGIREMLVIRGALSTFRSNKTLGDEALAAFYGGNRFEFDQPQALRFSLAHPGAKTYVHHLTITYYASVDRPWLATLLNDIKRLRVLHVRLRVTHVIVDPLNISPPVVHAGNLFRATTDLRWVRGLKEVTIAPEYGRWDEKIVGRCVKRLISLMTLEKGDSGGLSDDGRDMLGFLNE